MSVKGILNEMCSLRFLMTYMIVTCFAVIVDGQFIRYYRDRALGGTGFILAVLIDTVPLLVLTQLATGALSRSTLDRYVLSIRHATRPRIRLIHAVLFVESIFIWAVCAWMLVDCADHWTLTTGLTVFQSPLHFVCLLIHTLCALSSPYFMFVIVCGFDLCNDAK